MTKVFLSYAEEDSEIARRLVEVLEARGLQVFWYQDERVQGQAFIELLELEIAAADLFIALMSPEWLISFWCRQERQLALSRASELQRQFIYVYQVAATPLAGAGFYRNLAWIDLLSPVDDEKLRTAAAVVADLELPRSAPDAPGGPGSKFHNRSDEITKVVTKLATRGGEDFWLVLAPPRMGKTWFLQQVAQRFREECKELVPEAVTRGVDLRGYAAEFRSDWLLLLCTLLNVDPPGSGTLLPADETRIVAEVSRRSCPQLYLVDSAELMTAECVQGFRAALTSIYFRLRKTGNAKARLSVIVASRQQQHWQGYGLTGKAKQFTSLPLTEFGVGVVKQAVHEMDREFTQDQLEEWAEALHKLSEGLPALLVASLTWANDTEFAGIEQCVLEETFTAVARRYISDDLLAGPSLLPWDDTKRNDRKKVLEMALRAITPYRLFTESHLKFHLDDEDSARALNAAGWSIDDLWDALCRTALLDPASKEIWQVLSPPIRRLLYRYYYPDPEERLQAHAMARDFYNAWADQVDNQGQCTALVESLWHEATKLLYEAPGRLSVLLAKGIELTRLLVKPGGPYTPTELVTFVRKRMQEDEELARLFGSDDEQIFGQLQSSIEDTISTGGG